MPGYFIKTFGCQMNKHDSEVAAGLLEQIGLQAASTEDSADLIVFLTCCVRENADERLHGQVASLKALKTPELGTEARKAAPLIAVGGCIGQRDGDKLLEALPHVDIVFGTHNIERLPALYDQAVQRRAGTSNYRPWNPDSIVEVIEDSDSFAADLPITREHAWHAWLPITQGCDNFCTYCIVPYVRGREKSRLFEDVVAHAEQLVADGVLEITLLGQNVNSYGRDLSGKPRFADVLQAVAATGIKRLGFATSHPKDLLDETIEVMANTPSVLHHLHLPVQSGSNKVLKAMGRCYTREDYLDLVKHLRSAIPTIALSTDMIVGFPGETEADFADSLALAQEVCFDQMFTFLYSPREGTPAAKMAQDARIAVSTDVAQKRFDRLVECVQSNALSCNEKLIGTTQEALIEGVSKRDANMLTGRTHGAKIVHLPLPVAASAEGFAGKIVPVKITAVSNWFLQGELLSG